MLSPFPIIRSLTGILQDCEIEIFCASILCMWISVLATTNPRYRVSAVPLIPYLSAYLTSRIPGQPLRI